MNIYFKITIFLSLTLGACSSPKDATIKSWSSDIKTDYVDIQSSLFKNKIPIRFKSKGNRCFFGDYNVMRDSAKYRKSKHVILTIEPYNKASSYFTKRDKVKKLRAGMLTSSFTDKIFMDDGVYGLYICSDKIKSGTCSDKEILHIDEMGSILYKKKRKKDAFKTDKVFYYQPVLIADSRLYILPEFKLKNKKLAEFFSDVFSISKKSSSKIVKYAEKTHKLLTNMPLKVRDNTLILNLPRLHKECSIKDQIFIFNKFDL